MYPPYDFMIVVGLTFFGGLSIRQILRCVDQHRLAESRLPFAVAYILFTLILAFIWDDLPLKFYPPDKPSYVQDDTDGPDVGAGLIGGMTYILSLITNLVAWGLCVFLIVKSLIWDNRSNQ